MQKWLSLRRLLQAVFFLATAVPLCLLTLFHVQSYFFTARDNAARRLREAASGAAASVDIDLTLNRKAVVATGRALEIGGSDDPKKMSQILLDFHEEFSSFRTMLIADAQGKVVAFSAPGAPAAQSVLGSDISDRGYFREVLQKQKPFMSTAFRGRGFGTDPIVAFSAPIILAQKQYVVEGSLDLGSLRRIESSYESIPGVAMIVTDQQQDVLYASPVLGLQPLTTLQTRSWFHDEEPDSRVGRVSLGALGDSIVVRGRSANGWFIYTLRPLRVIDRVNQRFYAMTALLVFVSLVFSVFIGRFLTGVVIRPAEQVVASLQSFANTGTATQVQLPRFTPTELQTLANSFNSMAARLGRMLTGLLPTCAACKKVRDQKGNWSPMEAYIADHSEANFTHSMCPTCIQKYYPDLNLPKGRQDAKKQGN